MPTRYIALIRGINVGGRYIKMPVLKNVFENLGFDDISTYIQTGNVIFSTPEANRGKLRTIIEDAIEAESGYRSAVFVLTSAELEEAAKNNPFRAKNEAGEGRSHIVFLAAKPAKENVDKLLSLQGEDLSLAVHKSFLYYFYPEKYAGHTRRNVNFEKILDVMGTARTYKVVDKLIELTK